MALNFPSSPTVGQVYTDSVSGFSYEWNGTVWISFSAASSSQIKVIDDISGSFNGVTLSFALTTSGFALNISNAASLRINLGGVIQSPGIDYSVSGTNIVFTTAPESGLSFSGISLGPAIPLTIIPEGTATVGSFIVSTGLSATNLYVSGVSTFVGLATHTGTIFGSNISLTGIVTASTFRVGTAVTVNSSGINVSGIVTASSFVGTASTASFATTSFGLSGTPNITVGTVIGAAATFTNLTVNGTQTIINTTSLEITDKNIGIGSTSSPTDALADGAGLTIYGTTNKTLTWKDDSDSFTFSEGIDVKGAVETVSVGSTSNIGAGKVILECNAQNGTIFTHDLTNGSVGIVSLRNFAVTKNSVTTFSILFTQNSTGTANTTAASGIGTNITLTPLGVSGFSTSARVSSASTITLSTTASDVNIVTLAIHYNGSGTGTPGNYRVFASNSTGYRLGSIQP